MRPFVLIADIDNDVIVVTVVVVKINKIASPKRYIKKKKILKNNICKGIFFIIILYLFLLVLRPRRVVKKALLPKYWEGISIRLLESIRILFRKSVASLALVANYAILNPRISNSNIRYNFKQFDYLIIKILQSIVYIFHSSSS